MNFGPLVAEIDWQVWGPQQISTAFASWLRYCSDVAQRRPTKLCTTFGRLLGWYTMYTFSGWGALAPWRNFAILPGAKLHFASKSCVLYRQGYCTALSSGRQPNCVVVQGMELQNFRRGRHLYSAGRPSRWASVHILVLCCSVNAVIFRLHFRNEYNDCRELVMWTTMVVV